jgi:peptidoglycan/xylan/chitin deacetylase (PgdA/CDA1 family)
MDGSANGAERIPVLLYHSISEHCDPRFAEWSVTPALFSEHMRHLADNGYRTITAREFSERVFDRREALDPNSVVITFDDGLADFYEHAWPALRRHSHSATLYIATGFVGETSAWLADLGEGDRPMLTWSQIEELSEGGIECAAHGHSHVQMDLVSARRAWTEITRSRDALEAIVGRPVSFAYPHGYYRDRLKRQVARAGFSSACSVKDALSSQEDDRYGFARLIVRGGTSVDELERILRGDGIAATPGPQRLRRGAWRAARRAHAEPLVDRVRSRGARVPAERAR